MLRRWLGLDAVQRDLQALASDVATLQTAPRQAYDDEQLWKAIEAIAERVDETRQAVAEGIERVDRSERRIKQTVTRAKRKLADHGFADDGLEAEDQQLRLGHGEGGEGGGVPPLPAGVAHPPGADFSSFPGEWRPEDADLMRARGQ